ncbi:MAG: TonB-dependent receptor domain-containing protein [Salibacteraceae bacterium]
MVSTWKFQLVISLLLITPFSFFGQGNSTIITGVVLDDQSNSPVPYATIAVISKTTQKPLAGTTTSEKGEFSLSTTESNFYVEVSFLGYQKLKLDSLIGKNGKINLREIKLKQNTQNLEAFTVEEKRSTIEFKLDRRVFTVGDDITNQGLGALDVLNNVPSVNVDIEGNISLRGNSGVQILIDGKPSVLSDDGSNALGSITSDMIDRIEVITNPSAQYAAEGSSGIINIVLKKDEKKGFNGSGSVNLGYPSNNSVGISLNRRTEKFNLFTQMGVGYRSLPRYNEAVNYDKLTGTSTITDGIEYRNERFYNITLGTDYYLNKYNVITLSGRYAFEDEEQPSETEIRQFDSQKELITSYQRTETTTAENPKYQYDLQYAKEFKNNKEHTLQLSTLGKFFGKTQRSEFENELIDGVVTDPNQKTATEFFQRDFIFKADYSNPLTKKITIAAGGLYEINNVGNDYSVENQVGNEFVPDPDLTNNFEFNQKVLGLYATGAYEGKKWGTKIGLRVENTDLATLLTTTNQSNNQNYTNFFPSLHTSYKINKMMSFQGGYSRRIYRPRLWDLNPFFNIRNQYNIRRGNPQLEAEYADSYEITGIFIRKKYSLNASVYHLYTTNVIERVSIFEDNANITQPENIGNRNKTGVELNGKYAPNKWFTLSGDINFGYFIRTGDYQGQNFDFSGDQWSSKLTTKFKLPKKIDLEIKGEFQSRVKTVQGEQSGFALMDIGIRKKFGEGKTVVSLGVRDVFASRIRESYASESNFYSYNYSKRGRFFVLGVSYSFGKGEAMTYTGGRRH